MAPDDDNPTGGVISVEIAFSPRAGEVEHVALTLEAGATVGDALRQSACALPAGATIGIWGRLLDVEAADATPLRDRDRIEFYRPLAVDPMEARRRRALAQRVRTGQPTCR